MKRWKSGLKGDVHIVMNLPALAVEFLDAFVGLFHDDVTNFTPPIVHCYTFSKNDTETDLEKTAQPHDAVQDVRSRCESALGAKLPDDHVIRHVRTVAPNKDMMCVTFKLSRDVLFRSEYTLPSRKRALWPTSCPKLFEIIGWKILMENFEGAPNNSVFFGYHFCMSYDSYVLS